MMSVTETMMSKIPTTNRSVIGSLNIVTAKKTAETGSNAPNIATGVEPIFWIAALVQIREKAVGKNAIAKASAQSHAELLSTLKLFMSKLIAYSNVPKIIT